MESTPHIPDHELLRRIGKGAYGEVWLARNVTGAFRAVKIVYRSSFDHERPYEREFSGMQKYEPVSRTHETQVGILHVGRNDTEGYFYYVMEVADDRVAGQEINPDAYEAWTLRGYLSQHGRVPIEECLDIGIHLASALAHIHKNGLVHRDVKPSNIIFIKQVPKLADIGLVSASDAERSFVGTEGYIPPEGPGSPQADLYSLGKVLYEISTGKNRLDYPELPTVLKDLPERKTLVQFNEVVLKACEDDPENRYRTAEEMLADLWNIKSGQPITRIRQSVVKRRVLRGALMVGTVALGLALTAKLLLARRRAEDLAGGRDILVSTTNSPSDGTVTGPLTPDLLSGRRFHFMWRSGIDGGEHGIATLNSDGTISGINSPNESFWSIDGAGQLVFRHRDGRVSTIFTNTVSLGNQLFFSGSFQFNPDVKHELDEVVPLDRIGHQNLPSVLPQPASPSVPAYLKQDLVLWYYFPSDANGIVTDQSGSGNNAKLTGVYWKPDRKFGGALAFSPKGSSLRVPNNGSLNQAQFTLSAWIKTSRADHYFRRIFDKGLFHNGFDLTVDGDWGKWNPPTRCRGFIEFEIPKTGVMRSTHSIADGEWHHVAATYDGQDKRLFIDGQLQGKTHCPGAVIGNNLDLVIGGFVDPDPQNDDPDASFDGLIGEVAVFNRPLSLTEIWQLYDSPPQIIQRWTNSLGMTFVPVPNTGALFSIWDTRVQDYRAYAKTNPSAGDLWQYPGFAQGDTYPVVNISWNDAKAFCAWLTQKERAGGVIGAHQAYRLPTDFEWSLAAGISESTDEAPSNKRGKIDGVYPWGTQWPPSYGCGNYAPSLNVDSYDYTSPVGSFAANSYGLYDMGGNVWQWCEDWYDGSRQHRVVRGASWRTGNSQLMISSWRDATYDCTNIIGFRCVLAAEPPIR